MNLDNFLSTSYSGKKVIEFDSTILGSQTCITVSFTNRNTQFDYELELPFIMRNIEFSMPMAQFPIRIKPGDSLSLDICFTPDSVGVWRDTIIFRDTCSSLVFPLKGVGLPYITDANSDCDVNITSTILTTGEQKIFEIRPHPVHEQIGIMNHDPKVKAYSMYLLDMYGKRHTIPISESNQQYMHIPVPDWIIMGVYVPIFETSKGYIQLNPILIHK